MLYQFIKRLDTETRLGQRIISHLIPERYRKKFSVRYKERSRTRMIRKVCRDRKAQVEDLFYTCLEHISPVTEPLALISQVPFSGGMLLNRLFDGHPAIHARPHQLLIGYPEENRWPKIDLKDDPQHWFEMLFENTVFVFDYASSGHCRKIGEQQAFPFIFLTSLQREIFSRSLDSLPEVALRSVFDAYMTSYFGAWLNNQNGNGPKKCVTAYGPGLSMSEDNMQLFFEIYPDGRLISVVRDPYAWLMSARKHEPEKYGDFEQALGLWEADARAMLRNREEYDDRVCIIRFEDLVGKTRTVMHHLAEFLEVEFVESLLVPTFNTFALKGHTTMQDRGHGKLDGPVQEDRQLTGRPEDIIERMSAETYPQVLSRALKF